MTPLEAYRAAGRQPGETEAQFCERRGLAAEERARQHDAAIAEHRREGTTIDGGPAAFARPQDRFGFYEYGR